MYEWQNKSELFLPSGFSIPFCKGVGGYVSYESSIKSGAPCVIDATHARFLAKKRLPKLIFDFIDGEFKDRYLLAILKKNWNTNNYN